MLKKVLPLFVLILPFHLSSYAEEDRTNIYLNFEKDFLGNDLAKFERWINKDYLLTQTIHVPDLGTDSVVATREQVISEMKTFDTPLDIPKSTAKNISIKDEKLTSFCGESEIIVKTRITEIDYEEKEVRKVCFEKDKKVNRYKVSSHEIEVFYTKLL